MLVELYITVLCVMVTVVTGKLIGPDSLVNLIHRSWVRIWPQLRSRLNTSALVPQIAQQSNQRHAGLKIKCNSPCQFGTRKDIITLVIGSKYPLDVIHTLSGLIVLSFRYHFGTDSNPFTYRIRYIRIIVIS